MPTLSHHRHLLTSLLLGLLFEFFTPLLLQANDPYERVEQTDADYKPERIHELLGLLKNSHDERREAGIEAIRILGPEARVSAPLLIRQLENVEERFLPFWYWSSESDALADLGAEAVTDLVKLFPLSSPKAKRMIAKIAVEMGTDARELLPLLSQEYRTADKEIRPEYLIAIASIDPTGDTAFPLIMNALRTADTESERAQAAVCLENPETVGYRWIESKAEHWYQRGSQDPDKAVDALLQALKDKEPMVRGAAIEALDSYRKHGDRIVPELITLLDDDGEYSVWISSDFGIPAYVCDTAIFVLGSFPDHSEQSVPEIVKKMLRDERWLYVPPFEEIYAELIPHTAEPLEHLRKLLDSKFPDQTLLTIARMGQKAQPLIVKVAKLAESEDPKIALKAKITLACIDERWQGEANKLIEHEYLKLLDEDYQNDSDIKDYLVQIGNNAGFAQPTVLKIFRQTMNDEQEYGSVFTGFIGVFAKLGKYDERTFSAILDHSNFNSYNVSYSEWSMIEMAPRILPLLIERLAKPDCPLTHRILCLRVLGAAHAHNQELVPLVIAQLKSDHPAVRESAVEALGGIATKNEQSLEALIEALDDPRVRVRAKALESLAKFGSQAKSAIPKIIERLSDDYLTVRIAAVRCLGELGPTAVTAMDELEKLKNSDSLLLRETGVDAIEQIGSK